MTFLLSTMYPSALVIISLPSPTFHCMFTWLPLLPCRSCAGGQNVNRRFCQALVFTSEISVKREHGILIHVMRYFYFLMSVVGPPPPPPSCNDVIKQKLDRLCLACFYDRFGIKKCLWRFLSTATVFYGEQWINLDQELQINNSENRDRRTFVRASHFADA